MTDATNLEKRPETPPTRGVRLLVELVAFLLLAGCVIAMLLPQVGSRMNPNRERCHGNLKKIGLAIHNYYQKYGCLPPAYTVDRQGRRMHSWRILILEFLDPELYAQYDFNRPWNSPANLAFAKKMTKDGPYFCPSQEVKDPTWTSYLMPVGKNASSDGPHGRNVKEFTDGLSNTIMVIEMSPSGILWTSPYDLNVEEMSFKPYDVDHPGLRGHSGGAHAAMGDGSVKFVENRSSYDAAILKALITINGGENLEQLEKNRPR